MVIDVSHETSLEPVWITISYDRNLQEIVGKSHERVMVSKGCPFGYVLRCVLTSYPAIEQRFPPGVLGFSLNGLPPHVMEPIRDGDHIEFTVGASRVH